jgi:Cu/Ag efflux protein CusF
MKRWIISAALALTALAATAQSTDAEVRKVDKAQGRLTLKHAEIKHLDMPPMTMVFRVRDPAMLDGLAVGDKLKVEINKVDGQYTVTGLSKAN